MADGVGIRDGRDVDEVKASGYALFKATSVVMLKLLHWY